MAWKSQGGFSENIARDLKEEKFVKQTGRKEISQADVKVRGVVIPLFLLLEYDVHEACGRR